MLLRSGNIPLSHGIVLLSSRDIARVLGGKVPNLVEKWELNRVSEKMIKKKKSRIAYKKEKMVTTARFLALQKLAVHSRLRSVEEGGPPPWIPFGKKIIKGGVDKDKNFKALGKDSDKEATEFEAQRQDAIAEAARLGGKKIFGGGNKQVNEFPIFLVHEILQIFPETIFHSNFTILRKKLFFLFGVKHFLNNCIFKVTGSQCPANSGSGIHSGASGIRVENKSKSRRESSQVFATYKRFSFDWCTRTSGGARTSGKKIREKNRRNETEQRKSIAF